MKVVTIGLGYIGLPTSLMFARHGAEVVGVDISKRVVGFLNAGHVLIEEPGLEAYLTEALLQQKFKASLIPEEGDVFIIAVPTPNLSDKYGSCDLTYVKKAIESILPYLKKGNTVIIESTIAPCTTEDIIQPLIEKVGFQIGEDIFLVHCPERVLPGKILHELVNNNRIIGGVTEKCTQKGIEIYGLFVKGKSLGASASAAELAKLMENTYRDVNIALANELVLISEKLGIDALSVIQLANEHPRVDIHQPGPGVGGHCLAVDPYFIIAKAPERAQLIHQARKINSQMPGFIVNQVQEIMEENKGTKVTVLGLTYKGNVDDIRESPSLQIINELERSTSYQIVIFDPYVAEVGTSSIEEALVNSDLALVLTDHDEFKEISEKQIRNMKTPILFDTKNCVKTLNQFEKEYSLGRLPSVKQLEM
ncbi:nucleotide sugar dehydrogenase [Listeria aquatica]|uniref:Nucleotide sugar dehydrogenase n=1 Tax=Listeria aquatica TaxID=1494960 RepID=A0A841ZMH2_9LIST|nr:nucleotide sugar dehydrogenase [Listeria aquatica]MBC1521343.1 nucleotide sugar dehydrogenase [Listeria aquatica]